MIAPKPYIPSPVQLGGPIRGSFQKNLKRVQNDREIPADFRLEKTLFHSIWF